MNLFAYDLQQLGSKGIRNMLHECPEDAELHFALGLALADERNFFSAVVSFQTASRLDPNMTSAKIYEGRAWLDQHHAGEALECLSRAVEMEPCHGYAWALLGRAKEMLGRTADAIEAFRNAITYGPDAEVLDAHKGLTALALRSNAGMPRLAKTPEIFVDRRLDFSGFSRCASQCRLRILNGGNQLVGLLTWDAASFGTGVAPQLSVQEAERQSNLSPGMVVWFYHLEQTTLGTPDIHRLIIQRQGKEIAKCEFGPSTFDELERLSGLRLVWRPEHFER